MDGRTMGKPPNQVKVSMEMDSGQGKAQMPQIQKPGHDGLHKLAQGGTKQLWRT